MPVTRICDGCRSQLTRSAGAALRVLGDAHASDDERGIAADEAANAVNLLRLPPGAERPVGR